MFQRLVYSIGTSAPYAAFSRYMSSSAAPHSLIPPHPTNYSSFTVLPIALLQDNYAYVLVDKATQSTAVIDPAEAEKVKAAVESQSSSLNLTHILTTHKHWDHAGGNNAMKVLYPSISIVGSAADQVEGCTQPVRGGDRLKLGANTHIQVVDAPCHTKGHVLYHITDGSMNDAGVLFTGDTLFIGGCGKFFEGTADQMHKNMTTIAGLPSTTQIYCGHEYTQSNLEFGSWVEPGNEWIKNKLNQVKELREKKAPTIPSNVGQEKEINVFMRVKQPSIKERVKKWIKGGDENNEVAVLAALREAKNDNAHQKSGNL